MMKGESENKQASEKVARAFRAHGWIAEVFDGYAVSSPWMLVLRPGSVTVELEWAQDDKNEYAFHLASVDDGECVEKGASEAWRAAIMAEIAALCPAECEDPSVDLARTRLLAREFPAPFAEAMAAIGAECGDPIPEDAEMVAASLCKGELERIAFGPGEPEALAHAPISGHAPEARQASCATPAADRAASRKAEAETRAASPRRSIKQ